MNRHNPAAAYRAAIRYSLQSEDIGERIDVVLTRTIEPLLVAAGLGEIALSRAKIKRWIAGGFVHLDDAAVSKSGLLIKSTHEEIEVFVPTGEIISLTPDPSVTFPIVFEDETLLVIDKPAGLVVHPAPGNFDRTLVHGLLAHLGTSLQQVGDALRPGIVHRLDQDTSGLLVVAKNDKAYQHLRKQFEPPRTIFRTYLALTSKLPTSGTAGTIDLPIGRDVRDRRKMAVVDTGGKSAITHYQTVKTLKHGYLLELHLETGRTHQLRVHCHAVGAPIIGDVTYGFNEHPLDPRQLAEHRLLGRQFLHAAKLSFLHPETDQQVAFDAPLPQDLQRTLSVFDED